MFTEKAALKQLLVISEDKVIVSNCELDDTSILPFLDALYDYLVAILDLSHNMLGDETMKKLQQIFVSTTHIYGSFLTLNLHCNRWSNNIIPALYSSSLEKCSVTSRAVQTIADSLQSDSSLSHLALGKNILFL